MVAVDHLFRGGGGEVLGEDVVFQRVDQAAVFDFLEFVEFGLLGLLFAVEAALFVDRIARKFLEVFEEGWLIFGLEEGGLFPVFGVREVGPLLGDLGEEFAAATTSTAGAALRGTAGLALPVAIVGSENLLNGFVEREFQLLTEFDDDPSRGGGGIHEQVAEGA